MKAARRQELRTNVLSQQLDKLSEAYKRHSTTLAAILAAAAVIVIASYWYSNHRANVVSEAVGKLAYDSTKDDPTGYIERVRGVANSDVSTEVSRMAWLRLGGFALGQASTPIETPEGEKPKPTPKPEELASAARDAFEHAYKLSLNDPTARAAAHFGLGVLDENAGKFDLAKEHYNAVKMDKALANTPFIQQAEFRLAHLGDWARQVTFAPPPILPPAPAPAPFVPGQPLSLNPTSAPVIQVSPTPANAVGSPAAAPVVKPGSSPASAIPVTPKPVTPAPAKAAPANPAPKTQPGR